MVVMIELRIRNGVEYPNNGGESYLEQDDSRLLGIGPFDGLKPNWKIVHHNQNTRVAEKTKPHGCWQCCVPSRDAESLRSPSKSEHQQKPSKERQRAQEGL